MQKVRTLQHREGKKASHGEIQQNKTNQEVAAYFALQHEDTPPAPISHTLQKNSGESYQSSMKSPNIRRRVKIRAYSGLIHLGPDVNYF
ncbi:MAG TPA: hypothetical protein VMF58_07205 [Rhizomicrobium sp.]|nr:hypothetical protein [Rhizomicrobium sp.]